MTEDEMVGQHHLFNGQEFEQALGVGDGQGVLECCSPCGRKESDMTEQLNWTEPLKETCTIILISLMFFPPAATVGDVTPCSDGGTPPSSPSL